MLAFRGKSWIESFVHVCSRCMQQLPVMKPDFMFNLSITNSFFYKTFIFLKALSHTVVKGMEIISYNN